MATMMSPMTILATMIMVMFTPMIMWHLCLFLIQAAAPLPEANPARVVEEENQARAAVAAITTMTPPRQLTMITDLIHGESMMAMATATLLLLMMMDGSPPTILLSGLMMELQFQHPPVPPLQGMTMVATVANRARVAAQLRALSRKSQVVQEQEVSLLLILIWRSASPRSMLQAVLRAQQGE